MNKSDQKISMLSRIPEFFRYFTGCVCSLILKISLTSVLSIAGFPVWLSYFMTHVLLLVCSFLYHFCFTFQRKFETLRKTFVEFCRFSAAVFTLKLLDYFLVVGGISFLEGWLFKDFSPSQQRIFHALMILCVSGFVFSIRYILYRFLFRKKNPEYYLGKKLKSVWLTHSSDASVGANAASGGFVTALLCGLFRRKEINGAIVTSMHFGEEVSVRAGIATTEDALRKVQGSIYTDFPFLTQELIGAIRSFPGKLAVVAVPCQLKMLDSFLAHDKECAEKIVLRIGLFCGHTSQKLLLSSVLAKKGLSFAEISSFRYRKGLWRGTAEAVLKNGEIRSWPTAFYNLYQNLFIASPKRCFSCFDHYAEQADISTGDVWCMKYRKAKIKHSMTAVRTENGEHFFRSAVKHGDLSAEEKTFADLFAANSRSVVFHKAIAARAAVFRKYGITIPVPDGAHPARWNEKLAAAIIAHFAMMEPEKALKINRRILKFWLYIMKGLTSF